MGTIAAEKDRCTATKHKLYFDLYCIARRLAALPLYSDNTAQTSEKLHFKVIGQFPSPFSNAWTISIFVSKVSTKRFRFKDEVFDIFERPDTTKL